MMKLVVLFAFVAVASAKPHVLVAPAATSYSTQTVVNSAQVVPVVETAPLTATVVEKKHSIEYAPATTVRETVHYADTPVVTGHTSTILKPDLGALATPAQTVSQTNVIAPARAVHVPEITQVHTVDLVKTGHAIAAPAVTTYSAAVPAVTTHQIAVPAVTTHQVAAAPAVTTYSAAVPAVTTHQIAAAPAVTTYSAAVPALTTHQIAAAPITTYSAAIPAVATHQFAVPVATHQISSIPSYTTYTTGIQGVNAIQYIK